MNDDDRRVVWRDRKRALGLCATCGKRPVTRHQRTGADISRCAECQVKARQYDAKRRGTAA